MTEQGFDRAGTQVGRHGAGAPTVATLGVTQAFSDGPAVTRPARAVGHPLDIHDIQAVVDGIDSAVDAKDWAGCRSHCTERIRVDFAALGGEPVA